MPALWPYNGRVVKNRLIITNTDVQQIGGIGRGDLADPVQLGNPEGAAEVRVGKERMLRTNEQT